MIDIKPYRENALNCLECSIASIALWWNRRYELAYSRSWSFEFLPRSLNKPKLGERIRLGENHSYELLEKYHGIKVSTGKYTYGQGIDIINHELSMGIPVVIMINTYWCPWDINYKKIEYNHSATIVGQNPMQEGFYCIDDYHSKENLFLPFDDFRKGFLDCCFTFARKESYVRSPDWKDLLEEAASSVFTDKTENTIFSSIRNFAKEINESIDIYSEISSYNNPGFSPLIGRLEGISRSRLKFSNVLKYLCEQDKVDDLYVYSMRFIDIAAKWNTLRGMFVKLSFMKEETNLAARISNKLLEIADEEELLSNQLINTIQSSSSSNTEYVVFRNSNTKLYTDEQELTYQELESHFNNKAFSTFAENTGKADFIGNGTYLLLNNIQNNRILSTSNMRFSFPVIGADINDNISCSSQYINISKARYTKIMLLGCAEWGNYLEKLFFKCQNGKLVEIQVGFTDHYFSDPLYGESVALSITAIEPLKESKDPKKYPAYIYAKEYTIPSEDEIVGIILPECPNIHIFSITLAKVL